MPIKEEWIYILTHYRGFLSAIHQFGPIVHPAKVKKSEAIALMMSGCPVIVYDPITKKSYPLTIKNANLSVAEVLHEIPKPIEPTVLKGTPKGVIDFKKPEEEVKDESPVVISNQESTETDTKETSDSNITVTSEVESVDSNPTTDDEPQIKILVTDLLQDLRNGIYTEKDVKWSDYTKAERRQIRACLNEIAASSNTSTEE